jgi:hypothetical protein
VVKAKGEILSRRSDDSSGTLPAKREKLPAKRVVREEEKLLPKPDGSGKPPSPPSSSDESDASSSHHGRRSKGSSKGHESDGESPPSTMVAPSLHGSDGCDVESEVAEFPRVSMIPDDDQVERLPVLGLYRTYVSATVKHYLDMVDLESNTYKEKSLGGQVQVSRRRVLAGRWDPRTVEKNTLGIQFRACDFAYLFLAFHTCSGDIDTEECIVKPIDMTLSEVCHGLGHEETLRIFRIVLDDSARFLSVLDRTTSAVTEDVPFKTWPVAVAKLMSELQRPECLQMVRTCVRRALDALNSYGGGVASRPRPYARTPSEGLPIAGRRTTKRREPDAGRSTSGPPRGRMRGREPTPPRLPQPEIDSTSHPSGKGRGRVPSGIDPTGRSKGSQTSKGKGSRSDAAEKGATEWRPKLRRGKTRD